RVSIYGEGPARRRLALLARTLGLDGAVSFFPYVPHDKVPTVMAQHDVLVLPSLTEGLPRTVLEAFATGLPVLCSNLPQLVESFGNSALYFERHRPASIKGALLGVNNNPSQLTKAAAMARNLVEHRYSIEGFGDKLANIYRKI